jgi:hypothetical protein
MASPQTRNPPRLADDLTEQQDGSFWNDPASGRALLARLPPYRLSPLRSPGRLELT